MLLAKFLMFLDLNLTNFVKLIYNTLTTIDILKINNELINEVLLKIKTANSKDEDMRYAKKCLFNIKLKIDLYINSLGLKEKIT